MLLPQAHPNKVCRGKPIMNAWLSISMKCMVNAYLLTRSAARISGCMHFSIAVLAHTLIYTAVQFCNTSVCVCVCVCVCV